MHIIAYTGGAPAHYLDSGLVMHAPGKAQLGNPDWIRQQAAGKRGSVEHVALDNQGNDA